MIVNELSASGELTSDLEEEVGKEFTFRERLRHGAYGIGQLRLAASQLSMLPLSPNDQCKIHFNWTYDGAVIRIRTGQKLYGLGIRLEEITKITLTKSPNVVSLIPYFPMWILRKAGVPLALARWFRLPGDDIHYGLIKLRIELRNQLPLIFELKGDLWRNCLSTFKWHKVMDRLFIEKSQH